MVGDEISYEISDDLTVDQNVAVFGQKLKDIDVVLGPVFANHLAAIVADHADTATILHLLEAALLPTANSAEGNV